MKYLIGNQVINGDNITRVVRKPQTEKTIAHCFVEFIGVDPSEALDLKGNDADLFWWEYSGDAVKVVPQ